MTRHFRRERVDFLIATLAPKRLTRVVDIGASPMMDVPPYRELMEMGGCVVWGFEPQKDQYEKLVAEAGENEHYLNSAVGKGGPATLHLTRGPGLVSLFEPDSKSFETIGWAMERTEVLQKIEIDTRRLDDLEDLPGFDLLKIDVQGAETQAFEGGQEKLSGAVMVITEVAAMPLYKEQPLLDDQMSALRKLGFNLHRFDVFKRRPVRSTSGEQLGPKLIRSQLVDGDAFFVRGLIDRSGLDDETLKHLAILADAVIGSLDLSYAVVATLAERGVVSEQQLQDYFKRIDAALEEDMADGDTAGRARPHQSASPLQRVFGRLERLFGRMARGQGMLAGGAR